MIYADIIIDISHENLDKTYQYAVPERLMETAVVGAPVTVPFGNGNRVIKGYIVSLSEEPKIDPSRLKQVRSVEKRGVVLESRLIALAYEMKKTYGGTMNDCLRTVAPIKRTVRVIEKRTIMRVSTEEEVRSLLAVCEAKHSVAKCRLLRELLTSPTIDYDTVIRKLNINRKTITDFEADGVLRVTSKRQFRNPGNETQVLGVIPLLNEEQQQAADEIKRDFTTGIRKTYLLHGVTGSGKTEVYLDVIEKVVSLGYQVIMMIPEIALTFQTMKRFQNRFGDRVSFLHSRLSDGERYDQYERARQGEIDIMIGPRSALFTPFSNLGLIILDEEHEGSYKSEQVPKYHAREMAIAYSHIADASVLLGSATPSVESFFRAQHGEYRLLTLKKRAQSAQMPQVHIVDMREELKAHNGSVFSRQLRTLIEDRLQKKQQIMIFINRRGYAGFVSCRSCGEAMQCPHCAVSLTAHNNGKLMCHYCGYEEKMPKKCPKCGSPYIAAFGTGTQKVEALVQKEFPQARVLRMDADTTKQKAGHEKILYAFSNEEADILVGTQMIVKGHDFSSVTLMGILAADLSLQAADYRAGERTFQLLAQAAGRAGRAGEPGEVVIQTYQPEHYSIVSAATEDYASFFVSEMTFRMAMRYPPAANILVILLGSHEEAEAENSMNALADRVRAWIDSNDHTEQTTLIGPAPAGLSKASDVYRRVLYVKQEEYEILTALKDAMEQFLAEDPGFSDCVVQFDFNPMSSY